MHMHTTGALGFMLSGLCITRADMYEGKPSKYYFTSQVGFTSKIAQFISMLANKVLWWAATFCEFW